jgi:catechol 2,3-dioxygenase-like lactoylglutathione lyase family enzyme
MAIEAIDHLYIESWSFKDAVAFWESLGFKLVEEWGDDGHQAGRLEAGSAFIVLVESDTPTVDIHFRMNEAEALSESLTRDDHAAVVLPLEPTHWGTRWMRVQDPDGRNFVLEEVSR